MLHFPPHGPKKQTKVIPFEYQTPEDWPEGEVQPIQTA
jgi:hypothetical protein